MVDFKILGGVAIGAFLLSALIGAVSGAAFLAVLARALILAVVFAGLAAGAYWLIDRFLPDLLTGEGGPGEESVFVDQASAGASDGVGRPPGRRVDISVDGELPAAGGRNRLEIEEAEDPGFDEPSAVLDAEPGEGDDLPAGLDQSAEAGYTGEASVRPIPGVRKPAKTTAARPPALAGEVDILPDLESLSDSFISASVESALGGEENETYAPPTRGRSEPAQAGKFESQEMASAIQTILKRDQKG